MGASEISFPKLTLRPSGALSAEISIPRHVFTVGSTTFDLKYIGFQDGRLTVDEAVISFPIGEGDDGVVEVRQLRIGGPELFEVGMVSATPIQWQGFSLYLDDLSIESGVVDLEGRIRLPNDLPGELSGLVLAIEEFQFTTDGDINAVTVSAPSLRLDFPLFRGISAHAQGFGLSYESTSGHLVADLDQAWLRFPSELGIGRVAVTGLSLNLTTGRFGLDEISIEDLRREFAGIEFVLDELAIVPNDDFSAAGFKFSGSATLPDTPETPEALRGVMLVVNNFEVSEDLELIAVDASTTIGGQGVTLVDGVAVDTLTLNINYVRGSDMTIGAIGSLTLLESMPDGLAGATLTVSAFRFNAATIEIEELAASFDAGPGEISIGDSGLRVRDLTASLERVDIDAATYEIGVGGSIVMPPDLGARLGVETVDIHTLKVRTNGDLVALGAGASISGDPELFDGLVLRSGSFALEYRSGETASFDDAEFWYSVQNATVVLSEDFAVDDLRGSTLTIHDLRFSTGGEISALDISSSLTPFTMFSSVRVEDGHMAVKRRESGVYSIELAADFVLPDSLPGELAGLRISVDPFRMDTDGSNPEFVVSTSGLDLDLVGGLRLENGAIVLSMLGSELIVDLSGIVRLPSSLPNPLGGMGFTGFVRVSSDGEVEYSIANVAPIQFRIFNSLDVMAQTLQLSSAGISVDNLRVRFPDHFPRQIRDLTPTLTVFEMGWDGRIKDISGGIGDLNVEMGGFTVFLENLAFGREAMTVDSASLDLPDGLGMPTILFVNAGFDYESGFYGAFGVDELSLEIGGIGMVLEGPVLDIQNERISIERVNAKLPDALGGINFGLSSVSIRPSGVEIGGGSIRLPDFTLPGGMGFRDVHVSLDFENWTARGGGEALIPGLGALAAEVAFRPIDSTYPIGLEYARFEYTLQTPGLPLGSTGMYLNRIRGGITFGPPNEIPSAVRHMFDDGTRIQLGVTMVDQTGGRVVRGDVDLWIDITNWGFAFRGNVLILNGLARGEIIAALTGRGFYGRVRVELAYVRGQVELWVYKDGRRTRVSGSGEVTFGLRKGSILSYRTGFYIRVPKWKRWKMRWRRRWVGITINVPPWDLWLGSVGGAFGQFPGRK